MDSRIRSNILTRLCSVVLAMPLALLAVVSAAAPTSAYPTKTITLVVPYGPGGSSDIVARFLGDALGKELGKPVVVGTRITVESILGKLAAGETVEQILEAHEAESDRTVLQI